MKSDEKILLWFMRQLQAGKQYCLTWYPRFKHKDHTALLVFEALSCLTEKERTDIYDIIIERVIT